MPPADVHAFAALLGGSASRYSRSPGLWRAALHAFGIQAEYRAIDVAPEALAACLAGHRRDPAFLGGNVTAPHKVAASGLLDALDGEAQRVGAVNTIARDEEGRLLGSNTDGVGALRSLRGAFGELAGRCALLLGAGGAARAIAFALREALGAGRLWIANRTLARAVDLAAAVGDAAALALGEAAEVASRCDLVVNATSVGQATTPLEGRLPLPKDVIARCSRAAFFDLVYAPEETPLLAAARAYGRPALGGRPMLIAQAAESFVRVCRPLRADLDAARVAAVMEAAW